MKKPTLLLALCLAAASSAYADNVALDQVTRLANGASTAAMMDGSTASGGVVADAGPTGGQRVATTRGRGNITVNPRTPASPARASEERRPGFFSRTMSTIRRPSFLAPAGMALALGAGGAMVAGPLGALTGALVGGLLGFLFSKML